MQVLVKILTTVIIDAFVQTHIMVLIVKISSIIARVIHALMVLHAQQAIQVIYAIVYQVSPVYDVSNLLTFVHHHHARMEVAVASRTATLATVIQALRAILASFL
jgi:hypothetical protein